MRQLNNILLGTRIKCAKSWECMQKQRICLSWISRQQGQCHLRSTLGKSRWHCQRPIMLENKNTNKSTSCKISSYWKPSSHILWIINKNLPVVDAEEQPWQLEEAGYFCSFCITFCNIHFYQSDRFMILVCHENISVWFVLIVFVIVVLVDDVQLYGRKM